MTRVTQMIVICVAATATLATAPLTNAYTITQITDNANADWAPAMSGNIETAAWDFDNLLDGQGVAVNVPLTSSYDSGNGYLVFDVVSQTFTNGTGDYLYLYQINNTGGSNGQSITRFTASPYLGATSTTPMGYLNANLPGGFLTGDQSPPWGDVDADSGPTIGFNFPVGNPYYGIPDSYIEPGKSSNVLFVESLGQPQLMVGSIINGQVATIPIYGPSSEVDIPEPSTMLLLSLGGLTLLGSRGTRTTKKTLNGN